MEERKVCVCLTDSIYVLVIINYFNIERKARHQNCSLSVVDASFGL
jgi:hypothetical protein